MLQKCFRFLLHDRVGICTIRPKLLAESNIFFIGSGRIVEFQNIVFSQQIIFWPRFFLNAIRRINETRKNKFNDSIFYSTVSIIC